MAKKSVHKRVRHVPARKSIAGRYIRIIRTWMFVVAFAMMLGLGAIVGNFVKTQLDLSSPQVAGWATETR